MTIEERLETLEREARRSRKMVRWLGALFVLCVAAWIVTSVFLPQGMVVARDVADEIRTRRLVVVDEMGRESIVMNTNGALGPVLAMYDRERMPRIIANVNNEGGSSLSIHDKTTNTSLYMMISKNGVPALGITNAQGIRQIEARLFEGTPLIRVCDKYGDVRISMGVLNGDRPMLKVYEKQEKLRIFLGSTKSGASMFIYGKDEKPYILMGVLDEQETAALGIRNKQGDTIWSAP